jgi:hypothetical protein
MVFYVSLRRSLLGGALNIRAEIIPFEPGPDNPGVGIKIKP